MTSKLNPALNVPQSISESNVKHIFYRIKSYFPDTFRQCFIMLIDSLKRFEQGQIDNLALLSILQCLFEETPDILREIIVLVNAKAGGESSGFFEESMRYSCSPASTSLESHAQNQARFRQMLKSQANRIEESKKEKQDTEEVKMNTEDEVNIVIGDEIDAITVQMQTFLQGAIRLVGLQLYHNLVEELLEARTFYRSQNLDLFMQKLSTIRIKLLPTKQNYLLQLFDRLFPSSVVQQQDPSNQIAPDSSAGSVPLYCSQNQLQQLQQQQQKQNQQFQLQQSQSQSLATGKSFAAYDQCSFPIVTYQHYLQSYWDMTSRVVDPNIYPDVVLQAQTTTSDQTSVAGRLPTQSKTQQQTVGTGGVDAALASSLGVGIYYGGNNYLYPGLQNWNTFGHTFDPMTAASRDSVTASFASDNKLNSVTRIADADRSAGAVPQDPAPSQVHEDVSVALQPDVHLSSKQESLVGAGSLANCHCELNPKGLDSSLVDCTSSSLQSDISPLLSAAQLEFDSIQDIWDELLVPGMTTTAVTHPPVKSAGLGLGLGLGLGVGVGYASNDVPV